MTNRERFASTMAALALALPMSGGRTLTDELLDVYWRVLAPLSDAAFESAALAVMRDTHRPVFFPAPAELLAAAQPNAQAEAMVMLGRVRALAGYCPRTGSVWQVSEIRERLGEAAATGFQALGGDAGMRELEDVANSPFARQRFAAAFQEEVARDPATALPSPAGGSLPSVGRVMARIGPAPLRIVRDGTEGAA